VQSSGLLASVLKGTRLKSQQEYQTLCTEEVACGQLLRCIIPQALNTV